MEIPIPKEKVKRLHEGWDLFRFPPTSCLIVSCSQTAAPAPPIPLDTCSASLGNIREKNPSWRQGWELEQLKLLAGKVVEAEVRRIAGRG